METDEWLVDKIIDKFTFKEAQEIFDKYFKYEHFHWDTDKNELK